MEIGGTGAAGSLGHGGVKYNIVNETDPNLNGLCGFSGEPGEDAGSITIGGSITVYAYGGGGGSGAPGNLSNSSSGSAGGYPAAGIGGGRRWPEVVLMTLMELVAIVVEQMKPASHGHIMVKVALHHLQDLEAEDTIPQVKDHLIKKKAWEE